MVPLPLLVTLQEEEQFVNEELPGEGDGGCDEKKEFKKEGEAVDGLEPLNMCEGE